MSWQVISVIVLLVAIGSGMLWYERSRPPSQIVALVAVLAALAVAGRIIVAPVPNVVATTDIVIIAGFVLGPAPGFAVGALGGLVSNFWLGQGVWTPWQMVAWGMCGVLGGILWKMTGGRVNRWWLAAFCGAAGLLFGAWMNLQAMVSFGGEMSLDRYLALEARAIPFDIAHMSGNVIFALIAGPAMIAALIRFRERFEWRQVIAGEAGEQGPADPRPPSAGRGRTATGVTMLVLAAFLFVTAGGATPQKADAAFTVQAKEAATWLRSQQNSDGGFSSMPDGTSSVNITTRAMFALAAAGINPFDVKTNATPYGYLVNHRKSITKASDIALTILAMRTVGQNPQNFKGRNLVKALRARRGNGSFGNDVNVTAFAVLAFRSVGATKDAQYSIKWLNKAQNDNGGWGIAKGTKSGADSTGAALMAVTGRKVANRAIGFLDGIQKKSGGFGNVGSVNAQSTGLVMQGLVAQGRGVNYLKKNGKSAADYLLSLQEDDGSILYARGSDATRVWVTADGATALAGKTLPIAAPPREKDDNSNNTNGNGGASPGTGGTSTYDPGSTYTPPAGSLATPSTSTPSNPDTGDFGSSGDDGGNGGNQGAGNPGPDDTADPTTELPPTDTAIPLVPEAPSSEVLAASEAGPQPSPVIAILIALVVSGGLCGGTILLARRFRW